MGAFPEYTSPTRASFPKFHGLNLIKVLQDILGFPVLLGLGALIQLSASKVGLWYLPATLLLIVPLTRNLLVHLNVIENSYLKNIVPGRTTGSFPTTFQRGERDPEYAVFNLGIRPNSPLSLWSPTVRLIYRNFLEMIKSLESDADDAGLLNVESYQGAKRASSNTILFMFYFRSYNDIIRFAHGPHMAGWREYARLDVHEAMDVEIWHEAFVVSQSENVYVNCEPIGMGNAWMREEKEGEKEGQGENEKGEGQRWMSGLHSIDDRSTSRQRSGVKG